MSLSGDLVARLFTMSLQIFASLICRKDTKTIFLRNSTLLPVAWRVNGMDNLGDDFSLTTEHGVIDAKSEFALQMHFRAVRPTNIKKIVRLEVRFYPCYMVISELKPLSKI